MHAHEEEACGQTVLHTSSLFAQASVMLQCLMTKPSASVLLCSAYKLMHMASGVLIRVRTTSIHHQEQLTV